MIAVVAAMILAMTIFLALAITVTFSITATITTVTALVFLAFSAHVVTQRRTCATTSSRANQAAGITAYAAAYHVTACRAQTATDGCFCAVMAVCADCTTGCAADASANR